MVVPLRNPCPVTIRGCKEAWKFQTSLRYSTQRARCRMDQTRDAEGQFPLESGTLCCQFCERFEGLTKGRAHVLKVWF